jgi:hypothetical protein
VAAIASVDEAPKGGVSRRVAGDTRFAGAAGSPGVNGPPAAWWLIHPEDASYPVPPIAPWSSLTSFAQSSLQDRVSCASIGFLRDGESAGIGGA